MKKSCEPYYDLYKHSYPLPLAHLKLTNHSFIEEK